jgi:hypothetical protein
MVDESAELGAKRGEVGAQLGDEEHGEIRHGEQMSWI